MRKALVVAVNLLLLFLFAEAGARLYWFWKGLPFWTAQAKTHWFYYPDLKSLEKQDATRCADCLDVLMLGGSVLTPRWGSIEAALREKLASVSSKKVRVFKLSASAQGVVDSAVKYSHLKNRRFDLVVLYVGVNEVRANNCPPEVFRDDFSHYSWYKNVLESERGAGSRWFVLPYTLSFLSTNLLESNFVPRDGPKDEWLEYGCDIKTARPFRTYLQQIQDLAQRKHEPVVLMTVSYYLPEDYTAERFAQRTLDYTSPAFPVELWGKPTCVVAGLEAHNKIIKDLAADSAAAILVDQQALMPKQGKHFNDICHLTVEGSNRFAENIVGALQQGPLASRMGITANSKDQAKRKPDHQ